MSVRKLIRAAAAVAGVWLLAAPAAGQPDPGAGTAAGLFGNLSADQLAAAQAALGQLGQATGLSTARLTQLATTDGVVPTLTLSAAQQSAAAAALQQLSQAVGQPVDQLATRFGVTLPAGGQGGTGTGTPGGGRGPSGAAGQPTTQTQTPAGGAGTPQTATTQTAGGVPPGPTANGQPLPFQAEVFLLTRTSQTMQFLADEYGLDFPNQLAAFQFASDLFDVYARQVYGAAYQSPGVSYWLVRAYGVPR